LTKLDVYPDDDDIFVLLPKQSVDMPQLDYSECK